MQSLTDDDCKPLLPLLAAAEIGAIEIALAERLRAVTSHASRITDLARDYGIPDSTLRAVMAAGAAPKTFTIGRLIYCRRVDWITWLDGLAATGGTGPLSPPAGRGALARAAS